MSKITEILDYNEEFVNERRYERYLTTKFPDKKVVIVTCMDTRLVELLPRAMNLRNGDAKIIKNAGAIITQPFGNIMRSILVAIYQLNAEEVIVVGHHECGMAALNADEMIENMRKRGVSDDIIDTLYLYHAGFDLRRWLTGFDSVLESVENSSAMIRTHPLLPDNVAVHGMIIHPETGKLELVVDGYK